MARYDYEGQIGFAQEQFDKARKYNEEQAEKQEKFTKRLLAFDTVVKGANYLVEQRANALKQSLGEEKAFLMNAQNQAKKILDQDNKLISENKSQKEWIEEQMIEAYRSQIEKNIPGLTTQKIIDGKAVEFPKYDIPTSALLNIKLMTDDGEKTFSDLVNENLSEWRQLVSQAKQVPSKVENVNAYLNEYVDREMPTNVFDWMSRRLKRASKSETVETLEDKLQKSTNEILKNPLFSSFVTFNNSVENYQENFPNQIVDLVNEFKNDVTTKNGKLEDDRFNKIIDNVEVKYQTAPSEKVNPETNKVTTTLTITPNIVTEYVDNTVSTRDGESVAVETGEKLLVTLNSALLNTYENILSEEGMNKFNQHSDVIKNPVKAFNDIVQEGINQKGPNLNIKGDVDVGAAIEQLFNSPDIKEIIGVGVPLDITEFNRLQPQQFPSMTYEQYLDSHQNDVAKTISETLETIVLGLRSIGQ